MTGSLPLIGAQAVLVGVSAFNANAQTVVRQLKSMGAAAGELGAAQARLEDAAIRSTAAVTAIGRASAGVSVKQYVTDATAAAKASERVAQYMGQATIAAVANAQAMQTAATAARANATAVKTAITAGAGGGRISPTGQARIGAAEQAAKAAERASADANKAMQRQIAETVRAADDAAAKQVARAASVVRQEEELNREFYAAQTAYLEAEAAEQEAVAARVAAARAAMFVGITVAVLAVAAAMIAGERAAAEYNKQLALIEALSGASARDVSKLGDAQLELSRHTTQSAGDMAKGSLELVKAGFAISQVSDSTIKAINNMVVASGGELDAAKAASMAQVATQAFGVTVTDAADAATTAVQRSTLTFTGYADAMRQAGLMASKQGMSINEFSAVVGVMGKTITSGTEIGTGFRQMLVRLQDPSAKNLALMKQYGISLYDANGAARPFRAVLVDLEAQFGRNAIVTGKITQMQRDLALASMFGARSVRAVAALLDEGTSAYDDALASNVKTSDAAQKVMGSTAGQAKILANNLNAITIAFGKGIDPSAREATRSMNLFMQSLNLKHVETFGGALANISGVLLNIVGHLPVIASFTEGFRGIAMAADVREKAEEYQRQQRAAKIPKAIVEESDIHSRDVASYGLGFPGADAETLEKIQDAIKDSEKVAEEFNRAWAKLNADSTKEVSKLYVDTYDRIDKLTADNTETVRKASADAAKQVADINTAEIIRKSQEDRKKALDDTLKDAATTRRIGLEQDAEADKRRNEDAQRALKEQTDAAEQQVKRAQEDISRTRSEGLARDEAHYKQAQRQREQDLKDWQAIEERSLGDHQKRLELNLKEDQQARERALKDDQTRREQALKDALDKEERILKDAQRKREEDLQDTFKTEKARLSVGNDLQKVLDDDKRARDKARSEYQQDIGKGVRGDIAQKRLDKKLQDITNATAEGRTRVADKAAEDQRNLDLERSQQDRMDALKAEFEQQDTDRTAKAEQARRDLARDTENETIALRTKTEEETFALAQDTEGKLAALRESQERTRTALANQIADEELTHSQTNAKADADFRRGQEDAYIAAKKIIDATELEERRKLDDADLAHKEQLQQDETAFQEGQAAARLALEQKFQDEDLQRRLAQIGRDRDARIAEANTTLEKERQLQLEALARAIGDLRANLAERAEVIRLEYIDKLAGILEKGGVVVKDRVDRMAIDMNTALDSVGVKARSITDDVAAAFDARAQLDAAERRRAQGPPLPPAAPPGMGADVPTMQYGGVVPGRYGASQWIVAHGGERFEGLGAYNNTLASVRAAEAMWQRGIGGSHYVTNQVSYNVDAHYGRTQDEGSVARDLSALVMLTRN